jgi:quinol monooxygenase YgiN
MPLPPTPASAVHLLTRFRAVDEDAARQTTELLRGTAAAVASEHGHLTYDVSAVEGDPTTLYVLETWASAVDARRHADLVLDNGAVDRVLPLLRERLDTVTLVPIASHAAGHDQGGEAA